MTEPNDFRDKSTKDRIFTTAAQLFGTYGFERVSIRQICEAVGVGKPTLYYYFRDKESLLEELIDYSTQLGENLLSEFIPPQADFLSRFYGIIKIHQAYVKRYPYFVRFFTVLNVLSLPERIRQKVIDIQKNRFSRAQEFFSEGKQLGIIPPELDINLLVISFTGTIHHMIFLEIYGSQEQGFTDQRVEQFYSLWKDRIFKRT